MKLVMILFLLSGLTVYCAENFHLIYAYSLPDTHIDPGENNRPGGQNPDSTLLEAPAVPDTIAGNEDVNAEESSSGNIDYAVAELSPTKGNKGEGRITFTKIEDGIKISGEVSGLSPGSHGMHIHEFGNCSDPDALTAGGHYNPYKMPHGAPGDAHSHTGDLGNIVADENGVAKIDFTDNKISFEGQNSILGKSLIIHEGKDDLKSQPAGNSGKRVFCGVIKTVKKK